MSYMDELNFWLNDDYFDQKTKDELLAIRKTMKRGLLSSLKRILRIGQKE